MLASINPLGERARNQHYAVTVTAYVVASTGAAAVLGGALGFTGAPLAHGAVAFVVVALAAAVGLVADAHRFGLRVPSPRRQVDENWLVTYRGWVYGAGFGAQLGLAFTTIVTASATWVAFVCAFCSGRMLAGAVVGATFGLARALPVFAAARVRDAGQLRAVVRRLDRIRPGVAAITTAAQGVVSVALVAAFARAA